MYFHWLKWTTQGSQVVYSRHKKIVASRDVEFLEDKCCSDPLDIQQQESLDVSNVPIRLPSLEVQQQEETLAANPP